MVSGRNLRGSGGDGMRGAEITRWEGGILRASMPMAPPLRQVNSYILPEEDGSLTVIDPGPHTPETELAWAGVLAELGSAWTAVRRIVVTHHHPDHYGLAGWLQEHSGSRVWMSRRAYQEAQMSWGPAATLNEALPQLFALHGMPAPWLAAVREHLESFAPQVTPQPEVDFIDPAAPFAMGGRTWRPLLTGGHAPGHLSFHHAASGQLLCGDAVLPQISPNVGLQPGSDPQPLLTFLEGLRLLESVPVTLAFPGHREPFTGFTARVQSLLRHHEERLDTVAGLLEGGPLSGFAVCEALFRSRVSSAHQMRFAMSETLAHLAELVRRERAELLEPAPGAAVFAALR
ncbi:MBL fold metallo-hydrolase [Paenibacillus tengchongensis]|uniref:MBL fold metallo-hydrolase n=1 Tax=Paenibacillus tengchongensis TaxID=2608684 RepID=UPI001FE86BF7|nr:MBL fold metallo-hydrolase [Paenibacillus tengchongensis]